MLAILVAKPHVSIGVELVIRTMEARLPYQPGFFFEISFTPVHLCIPRRLDTLPIRQASTD
jgi:hypothetical protein